MSISKQSFDNNGFIDYDYEDLAYHSDLDIDSGYQEPQEVLSGLNGGGTLSRGSPRPLVSSPTRIEKPNMAPLNMYPMRTLPHPVQTQQTVVGGAGTLGKQRISTTLSRRMGGGGGGGGGDHHHQHGSNIWDAAEDGGKSVMEHAISKSAVARILNKCLAGYAEADDSRPLISE